ncbi:MAG: hypothetical protein K8S20_00940 [Chloroflexi bacterium]|nr:hypothetical protein [Chloroflexota bacterium]
MTETQTISTATYCYVHPDRETSLRCKRCERYICTSCAVGTPTGYMCRECVNQHKKIFDTALWYDYLTGFGTTFILSLIASGLLGFVASFIGFYMIFVSIAVAGGAGVYLSNIALRVTGKRRSRWLFIACAAGVAAGAVPIALFLFFTGGMLSIIMLGIYAVVATSTVYARLAGIQL